jgi:hypothetical protein
MTLRSTLNQLAVEFVQNVLKAIRSASLEELLEETGSAARARLGAGAVAAGRKKGARLGRRSADDIAAVVDRIVDLLGRNPEGLRAEQIRSELGLLPKELPRPIADALAEKRISKHGQRRATTYFAKGGAPPKRRG